MAGTRDTTHVVGLTEEGGEGALLEHGGFSSFFAQRASERRGKFLEGFFFFFCRVGRVDRRCLAIAQKGYELLDVQFDLGGWSHDPP